MNNNSDNLRNVAKYSTAALEMVAVIIIGVWSGISLDDYFNTKPVITIVAALLSVAAGIYLFIKDVIKK